MQIHSRPQIQQDGQRKRDQEGAAAAPAAAASSTARPLG